jgi:hypothetical protein
MDTSIIEKAKLRIIYFYRFLFSYKIQILLLLFFVFSFLNRSDLSFDQDLGMHLKLGEIIWQTRSVPKINLVSYTNTNFPFINHHWLFEVLAYLGSITIGIEAMLILKTVIVLICIFLILLISKKSKSVLFFSVSFIFLHLLRARIDLRPEILSFLFTVIMIYILELYYKKDTKLVYLLPLIVLLWTNTHIYFPVGIFLELIFLGDLLFRKYIYKQQVNKKLMLLSGITTASIICSFINPNFISGALYPFTVFNNYGVTITENQTVFALQNIHFVDPDFLFFYLSVFIVLGSIYTSIWRTKFSFKNIFLSLLGLSLAFQSIRGFPYLVLISLPYVLLNFNYKTETILSKTINIVFVILLIGESLSYLNGQYYGLTYEPYKPSLTMIQDEKPAADFLLAHNLPQPIFNNFDTGSYLVYRAYPEYKVFIDERPEAFPATFFSNTYDPMQENYKTFKVEEKKYGFKTVFFTISDQTPGATNFLNKITKDPEWKTVFLDQYMIILVKTTVQQELGLPSINLSKLNINNYHYSNLAEYTNLSTFLFNINQPEEAQVFDQKALNMNSDNPGANKIMVYMLYTHNPNDYRIHTYLSKMINLVFW